jgi:hypothetical protein
MASDYEVAVAMNEYLRANGYICGRIYADVPKVLTQVLAKLPDETSETLGPKVKRVIANPAYEFKSKENSVSASDPKCGN